MASVKDLMKRRVSTPKSKGSTQTQTTSTKADNNDSHAPALPTPTASALPTPTVSASCTPGVASDGQMLAHLNDATDARQTLQNMDNAINGLQQWKKERVQNLAKLKRQLRQEENARLAKEAARREKFQIEDDSALEDAILASELARLQLKRQRLEREKAEGVDATSWKHYTPSTMSAPALSKDDMEKLRTNPLPDEADLATIEEQLKVLRLKEIEASATVAVRDDIRKDQAKAEAEVVKAHVQMLQDAGAVEEQLMDFQTDLDDILSRFASLSTVEDDTNNAANANTNESGLSPPPESEADTIGDAPS